MLPQQWNGPQWLKTRHHRRRHQAMSLLLLNGLQYESIGKHFDRMHFSIICKTRKLSYHKDDRAIRPMYGRPEYFEESLTTPTATVPEFLMGFCSDWAHKNAHAKFEIRSFNRSWDNMGYAKLLGSPWIRQQSLFSEIFNGLLFGWTLWMYWPNLKSVAFPVPEIIGVPENCPVLAHTDYP